MKQKVLDFIRRHQLLQEGTTVVVGVSGGPDSLALLHFLWRKKEEFNIHIVAAHVDHQLRGRESEEDLLFVQRYCLERQISFEGKKLDVKSYQLLHKVSLQMAARECRYTFFEEVMNRHKGHYLALAHHGDDQVETMLMKQVRGTYSYGLSGIPLKRPFANGMIIRPFLGITKDEIVQYCIEECLEPRIDPSNTSDTYVRNRFRQHVLPFLKEENTKVHLHFQQLSEWNGEDERFLEELTRERMEKVIRKKEKEETSIYVSEFCQLALPLQRRGIHLILNYLYGKNSPIFSAIHIEKVRQLLASDQPSLQIQLPKNLVVRRSYGICTFSFNDVSKSMTEIDQILSVPGMIETKLGKISGEIVFHYPKEKENKFSYICHADGLHHSFLIRTMKAGDRINLKGLDGTKKISRLFIDKKIDQSKRNIWPIVVDDSGEIVWVPLLAYSKKGLVTEMSQKYLVLTFEPNDYFLL